MPDSVRIRAKRIQVHLRCREALHRALTVQARNRAHSLNTEIIERLEWSLRDDVRGAARYRTYVNGTRK
jgi:hypothetical protein